jgi:hypothetical protein
MKDCYLVLARCAIDDIPLRLFTALEEASHYARTVGIEEVERVAMGFLRPRVRISPVIGIDVMDFRGGVPIDHWIVRTFEDEDRPPAAGGEQRQN